MSIRRRPSSPPRPARRGLSARLAAVAGIVTFAVLAGTGTSWAYFTAGQSATATATAGTLAVSTTNLTSVAYTFRNDALDTVGGFTVTNTSTTGETIARPVSITLSATGDTTALGAIRYLYWQNTTGTCTSKNTVSGATLTENVVGTPWSTPVTFAAATSLAPGASISYCLESYVRTASSLASSTGARTITPSVSASLTAGSWSAVSAATTTQASGAIYTAVTSMPTSYSYVRPSAVSGTQYCLDVDGNVNVQGTPIIAWPCKTATTTNQIWSFVADGNNTGYYSLQPNNAQTRVAEQSGTGAGSLIVTNTATTTSTTLNTQDWQVQQVSTGLYQFVNASSGMCLSATNQSGDTTMQSCNDAASTQRFIVSPYVSAISCSTSYTGNILTGYSTSLTLKITTANTQTLKVLVGGTQVATGTASSGVATITATGLTGSSAANVVITDSSSQYSSAAGDTVIAIGTVTPRSITSTNACTASTMVN